LFLLCGFGNFFIVVVFGVMVLGFCLRVRAVFCVLVFCCVLVFLEFFGFFRGFVVAQPVLLGVVNVDTGLRYGGVQEAVDAVETLDGHVIRVGYGVFQERVVVDKAVSLVGEGSDFSVVDGMRGGVVVDVVSDGVEIRNLGIRNGVIGLRLDHADGCRVVDNVLYGGSYGLRVFHSRDSVVVGNRISGCAFFGVELDSSGNTTLRGNWLSQNRYGFGVDGLSLADFVNDVDESNFVNGKPVRYLLNQRDLTIDPSVFQSVGFLGVVNSSNIVVRDLEVQSSVQGVLFAFVANSSIVDVRVSENWNGVFVTHSRNVTVSGVKTERNFDYGIKFFNSSGSRVFGNDAKGNNWAGIGLFGSHFSAVKGNLASGTYGLHVVFTNSCVFEQNTVEDRPNSYSIAVFYSHGNVIFHNVFANSLLFVEMRDSGRFVPSNAWDNGVEGNFWLSYGGVDEDLDGIGDTVHSVGENNVDGFPLMGRFFGFDVVVEGRSYSVGVVSNSSVSGFEYDLVERQVRFTAKGDDGTLGFSRVSVPGELLQLSDSDNVAFLVNEEVSVSLGKWVDESHVYWYLSYVNVSNRTWFSQLSVVLVVFVLMIAVVLAVFRRRRKAIK
jgi:parallel beta-helix repeat protein